MRNKYFAWYRLVALSKKEFTQIIRDRLTFFYVLLVPVLEVILFSLVFNSDPKHLPTAVLDFDPSPFTRTIIRGLENTAYFDVTHYIHTEQEANDLLASGEVQFVVFVPVNFSKDLVRGNKPRIVLQGDALNPLATNNAFSTAKNLESTILQDTLKGSLAISNPRPTGPPFEFFIDPKFNPERKPTYFSVPGLIGVVIGASLLSMTLISITKERDSGTMESLLSTPTQPVEVILSKIIPNITISFVQFTLVILIAYYVFDLPFNGSVLLLYFAGFFFMMASLLTGLFISGLASSPFQALQLGGLFLLPNILFSGFLFPFRGMPLWGQWLGEVLPVTHFLRIITGILLKGNDIYIVWSDIWPIIIYIVVVTVIMVMMFRSTLD